MDWQFIIVAFLVVLAGAYLVRYYKKGSCSGCSCKKEPDSSLEMPDKHWVGELNIRSKK